MNVYVVDASVAAKWFTEEGYAEESRSLLDEGNFLHAPDHFFLEMDSILCKWIRREIISADEAGIVRNALRRIPVRKHPFAPLQEPAYMIAVQTGQSIYDCLYIALAVFLKGRMVTADQRLYEVIRNGAFKEYIVRVEDITSKQGPAG